MRARHCGGWFSPAVAVTGILSFTHPMNKIKGCGLNTISPWLADSHRETDLGVQHGELRVGSGV